VLESDRKAAQLEIASEVARPAARSSKGAVAELVALANAEDQFRRDDHGRFLIELIQNTRDTWVAANGDSPAGSLLIQMTDKPALIVADRTAVSGPGAYGCAGECLSPPS
jgi:hypothetical protein